jgi:hypothetical protein
MRNEPVVTGFASLNVLVAAAIGLAQTFGWIDWSTDQIAAIIGLVTALSAVIAPLIRKKVITINQFQQEVSDISDEAFSAGFNRGLFMPVPEDAEEWLKHNAPGS